MRISTLTHTSFPRVHVARFSVVDFFEVIQGLTVSMSRVYVGRISYQVREKDVERFFRGFGRIKDINLKNGFGFVVGPHSIYLLYTTV